MNKQKLAEILSVSALALALTACGGGGGSDSKDDNTPPRNNNEQPQPKPDDQQAQVRSALVEATSQTAYTYFNLTTGQKVDLTDEQAASSKDWHIAFRRTSVKLNGGDSGPGNVGGALLVAQDDFYDGNGDYNANAFLNATPDSELEHLTGDLTPAQTLVKDRISSALDVPGEMQNGVYDFGWYLYNMSNHQISGNDQTAWLLRSGEGNSYARFRATSVSYSSASGMTATFSFDVQPAGTSQFTSTAEFTTTVASGSEACFDFDGNQTVDCASAEWDLKLGVAGRSFYLRTNSGVSGSGKGGALGPWTWDELKDYQSATTDPGGSNLTFLYTADYTGGIFVDKSWYGYGVTQQPGDHKLYPNYRVYQIATDAESADAPQYALQITGYYHPDTAASGFFSLRWRELKAD